MMNAELISSNTTDEAGSGGSRCYSCGFESVGYGQFCRLCGALLADVADLELPDNPSETLITNRDDDSATLITNREDSSPSYSTKPSVQKVSHRHISESLIETLTTSLLNKRANGFENRMSKILLLTLIVLPLWLLIIAISPFDAFLAARTAVKAG